MSSAVAQPVPGTPGSVIFICTGNICRSPIGERVLRDKVQRAGMRVESTSAGVGAANGHPMHPLSAEVLSDYGYDPAAFESRYLRPQMLAAADLALCMTREHRAATQQLFPARWKRAFTLTEFAALLHLGNLGEIVSGRAAVDTNAPELDILDPMGRPRSEFDRVYSEIEPKVASIVEWMSVHSAGSGPGDDGVLV